MIDLTGALIGFVIMLGLMFIGLHVGIAMLATGVFLSWPGLQRALGPFDRRPRAAGRGEDKAVQVLLAFSENNWRELKNVVTRKDTGNVASHHPPFDIWGHPRKSRP